MTSQGQDLTPIEIKSGQTVASDFFAGINYWQKLLGDPTAAAAMVYGGERSYRRSGVTVCSWTAL